MSLRRSKPRPPLRPVNAADSIRVPKLKAAQAAPKPQQTTDNARTTHAEAILKTALANENEVRVNERAIEAASEAEELQQPKQEMRDSPTTLAREVSSEASGETGYPSFEEIFGWDWGRMQRELKQLSAAMQQSNPAAADFLRRCILRIDVLMDLPSQPNDDGEGEDEVLPIYAAKTPQQLEPKESDDGDDGATEEQRDSTVEESAESKQVPMRSSPWRETPMRVAVAASEEQELEREEAPATLEKQTTLQTQFTLPPEFAPTPAHLQRAETDDSTAPCDLLRSESNDCASPEVRGTMFDDEDEDPKPAASTKARGGRKKQEKPKPVARRRSLRVAKATQQFDVHDDFAEQEQQYAAAVVSPVKMTEEASSYCSPEPKPHATQAAANDKEQEQQGEEEPISADHESTTEVSPASSDGGLATVMSSLTLADNMASSAMQGTPFQRESARKPKVKRLRLNSTAGKTTMAAFDTPSRSADDSSYATEVNAKQQKRRRARVDAPLTSDQPGFVPTPVIRPEEKKEEQNEQQQQQAVQSPPAPDISVSLTTSDVLSFLPPQSGVGELTSGALVLMFGAAATRALCDTKPDQLAASLQAVVDAYWQMCEKCANSSTRCLSPTSSLSSSSNSASATQSKKKKSVRFCADVSGVCPINDREMSTVHQASASISALEQYLQKLSEFRKGVTCSSNAGVLLIQVLLQTSQRQRELSRQFHAMATELLGERHSATFAEEAARDAVAELEDRPMGTQRPLHYRLTWLCSSAVRYHLRFLLDPPPPSPSVPPVTGYQPPYSCRSSLHRKICLDQPTVAQEWIQCTGSDPKPEWSLSSSVMHALWQFHTALRRVAADDSELPADELSRSEFSSWLRRQSAKLTSDWIETGTGAERLLRAQLLMAAEVARGFLFHVFSHEDVVAAAAECGAFAELERFAELLLCAEGVDGDDSHLTLLVHISELVSVVDQPLCSLADMQRFRTMLAQHHSLCGPRPPKKKLAELGLTADDVTEVTSLLVESPYVFEYPSIVGSEAG